MLAISAWGAVGPDLRRRAACPPHGTASGASRRARAAPLRPGAAAGGPHGRARAQEGSACDGMLLLGAARGVFVGRLLPDGRLALVASAARPPAARNGCLPSAAWRPRPTEPGRAASALLAVAWERSVMLYDVPLRAPARARPRPPPHTPHSPMLGCRPCSHCSAPAPGARAWLGLDLWMEIPGSRRASGYCLLRCKLDVGKHARLTALLP